MSGSEVTMRTALWLVVLASLAGLAFGGVMVLDDLGTRGEWMDGLGLVLGGMTAGAALLVGAPAALALATVRRRPRAARVVAAVLGGLLAGLGALSVPAVGVVGLVALVAGGVLLASSCRALSVASGGA